MHDDETTAARALAKMIIEAAQRVGADPQALAQTMDDVIQRKIDEARENGRVLDPAVGEALLQSAWIEALGAHAPATAPDVIRAHAIQVLNKAADAQTLGTTIH